VEHSNQSHLGSGFDSLEAPGVPSTPLKQTYAYAYGGSYTTSQRRQWVGAVEQTVTTTGVGPFGETNYVVDGDAAYGSGLEFDGTSTVYDYDKSGALVSTTRETDWGNGIGWQNQTQTIYGYDGAGRLASLDHAARRRTTTTWPAFTALVGFDYGYDGANRISSLTTDWNTSLPAFSLRTDASETLQYDGAGQLTNVDSTDDAQDAVYALLANGNRWGIDEGAGPTFYAHGDQNRTTGDSTYTYAYDAEGNLTERKFASGGATDQKYYWDHKNRLVKVENYAAGLVAETIDYRYDAAGGLVRRSVTPAGQTAVVEHYALEGGRRALTLNAAGNVKQRYAYAPSGEVLVDQAFAASGAETQLTTPLADHQGSARILYGGAPNSAPAVRQSVDYAPFGRITEIRDSTGAPTTSALDAAFGHHGSLVDPKTGLQYKSEGSDGRWYSADLGRFVSVDPIHDGSNWYAFAGNDPINQSDPTGLKAVWSDPRSTLSGPNAGGPSVLNSFGAHAPGYRTSAPRSTPIASAPLTSPGYKLQSTSFDTSLRTSAPRAPSSTQQIGLAATRYTPYASPATSKAPAALSPQSMQDLDYFARLPKPRALPRDTGPSLNDVMNGYFNDYANNSAFRNRMDDNHSRELAMYDIATGTPYEAFRGRLMIGVDAMAGSFYPGLEEMEDGKTFVSREATLFQRGMAGASLALSVLSLGESPNYSGVRRSLNSVAYTSHTIEQLADLRRMTQQVEVHPSNQVLGQFDTTLPIPKGGSYETVRLMHTGGDVHHTPATSVSSLSREAGPSYHMATRDHAQTASFGGTKAARAYRDQQRKLVNDGKWMDAIQMDIDDTRRLFGKTYDAGIDQMVEYARRIGLIE
jgi:RHS repeat-associated protein